MKKKDAEKKLDEAIERRKDTPSALPDDLLRKLKEYAENERASLPLSEELELGYELFGNPLFVWAAIQECKELGKPYPKWIRDYLEEEIGRASCRERV